MDYENLTCERDGAVVVVTMNRPAKLNSLSLALLSDLAGATREIAADSSIRAAVLSVHDSEPWHVPCICSLPKRRSIYTAGHHDERIHFCRREQG